MVTETTEVSLPADQRHVGCECKSGINTFDELVKVIELAQSEYVAQWAALEETAKLLESFGWKHGVGVMDEYNVCSYDEKDPYQLSWVVQEGVYLATGYGTKGDLNGGYQEGDFFVKQRPLIAAGIKHILTNPRCQRTKLTGAQQKQLRESFEQAYHMHLHFYAPMSRIYTFIHEKLGVYVNSIAIPAALAEAFTDWLLDVRHERIDGNQELYHRAVRGSAEELLEIITEAQSLVKQRSAAMPKMFKDLEKRGFDGDLLRKKVEKQLDWVYTYHGPRKAFAFA